ncbi:lysine 2,3-aminomutase YodO family protein [Thermodesulfatator indicus DSM 15286]|uniref:Lysine 2,3-aminomutase YodO family protein n=1 Tax=Thermodesulfatator indicus (strain DSM 15286 / JCM 11887 / CIR29812) TaxID=667014 RepID=F8AD35_THEID|nr:KamA family radical SAM protein [Thermodesulfatator indicus]AEH45908.1 lysine 2,3-aminomutase YodO family protein [Thermodesulfatator indicus DSM 15286]
MLKKPKFVTSLENVPVFSENKEALEVANKYPIKCTEYYLKLINFEDPKDPLARLVLPSIEELEEWEWGSLDPSNEASYTVMPGLQHKYDSTVLVLASNVCAGLCRYCFRKRLFMDGGRPERLEDIDEAVKYIASHKEITNVILSGGDAFMLSNRRLKEMLSKIRPIEHVGIIRIGTKVPAFYPQRIIEDPELLEIIKTYSTPEKRLYIMVHFDHPKELTAEAIKACDLLMKAGAVVLNQTPIIRGVNDDPEVMAELFRKLSFVGIAPYYIFQCRPTTGNKPYAVPIEEGYQIFEKARGLVSGVAKRARFTMSHALGKLEILALTDEEVIFKFHRAADNRNTGKILIYKRNPDAYWLDDYTEMVSSHYLISETTSCPYLYYI